MGDRSTIEWTEATWNPVTGCSKVSPGCAHCYAEAISLRFGRSKKPWTPANAEENVVLHPGRLEQPLRWKRPRMIFVNSMSDLFHELVPDDYIAQVFAVMEEAERHTFQVLTKRPERLFDFFSCAERWAFLPNVWMGTSIENRRFVGRADDLRRGYHGIRFISAEPLLGPLLEPADGSGWDDGYEGEGLYLNGIDWLIVGGESGPHHRPMDPQWVRDLRDATRYWAADEVTQLEGGHTAFFFKQWGGRTPKAGGREFDGRTWDEMPSRPAVAA